MTARLVVPEPSGWVEVVLKVARVGLVPYSNHAFVTYPFGFTFPLRTALVVAGFNVAAFVVTVGDTDV